MEAVGRIVIGCLDGLGWAGPGLTLTCGHLRAMELGGMGDWAIWGRASWMA